MSHVEMFYNRWPEREWARLDRHPAEFGITMRALRQFISPRSNILDIGGGPGRYSIELTKLGHRVTLADVSQELLDLGRKQAELSDVQLAGIFKADARDLRHFQDSSFDSVLCMGPLYHLVQQHERDLAIHECLRVLKPGGTAFFAVITVYAAIVNILAGWQPGEEPPDFDSLKRHLKDGRQMVGEPMNPNNFTDAYFAKPIELRPMVESQGFEILRVMSQEGYLAPAERVFKSMPEPLASQWLDFMYDIADDPATWTAGEHMLCIAKKPK